MYNYSNKIMAPSTIRNPNIAISLPAAIAGGVTLILYFLLLSILGLQEVKPLRFLNFVFLIPVVIYCIRTYVNNFHNKSYLEAFRVSLLAFWGSYAILALFMIVYLLVINPAFMVYLQTYAVPGIKLNAFGAAALLIGEGSVGAVVISFVILQFYKDRLKRVA